MMQSVLYTVKNEDSDQTSFGTHVRRYVFSHCSSLISKFDVNVYFYDTIIIIIIT